MGQRSVRGIVLNRRNLGENEALATLFTLESGKAVFAARGTKKLVSSLAPALELYTEGDYHAVERRGLDLIVQAKIRETFGVLKRDLEKISLAGYMARLVERLTAENSEEPGVFWLLRNALFAVQTRSSYDIMRLGFELAFLRLSGLAFSYARCVACGGATAEGGVLDAEAGGVTCAACSRQLATDGEPLSASAIELAGNADRFFSAFARPEAGWDMETPDRTTGERSTEIESGASTETIQTGPLSTSGKGGPALTVPVLFDRNESRAETAELQRAVTRFYRRHFDEPVDRWYVRL